MLHHVPYWIALFYLASLFFFLHSMLRGSLAAMHAASRTSTLLPMTTDRADRGTGTDSLLSTLYLTDILAPAASPPVPNSSLPLMFVEASPSLLSVLYGVH